MAIRIAIGDSTPRQNRRRYDARMPFENGMLPEMLLEHGYNTFCVGKWHLSPSEDKTAAGPFHCWPLGPRLERFYGFLGGETNQWYPDLRNATGQSCRPSCQNRATTSISTRRLASNRPQRSGEWLSPRWKGVSFVHTFDAPDAPTIHSTQYFEMFAYRAVDHDAWRAVCPWPGVNLSKTISDVAPFDDAAARSESPGMAIGEACSYIAGAVGGEASRQTGLRVPDRCDRSSTEFQDG